MPLPLTVSLLAILVMAIVGVLGYLIDTNEEKRERR
jgi:hypothetical protein